MFFVCYKQFTLLMFLNVSRDIFFCVAIVWFYLSGGVCVKFVGKKN